MRHEGIDRPLQAGLQHLSEDLIISKARIPNGSLIGRNYIPDLGESVSRVHAELDRNGVLSDLGSRRGTFVNGKLLQTPVRLQPSDKVRLGHENHYYHYNGNSLILKDTTIGRNEGHDWKPLFDNTVSRDHAKISSDGVITDLNSSFGTWVDGKRLTGPQQLQNGNLISLGAQDVTHYYYNHGKLHPLTPEKAQILKQLFPQGIGNSDFRQGTIGNCTFLAGLKSLLKNDPARLIEMIEAAPNGKVRFTFKGAEKPPFELDLNDFKRQGVQGPRGVQLLETAFGRYLKPSDEINTIQILDEGGYATKAIKALTSGKEASMVYDNGRPLMVNDAVRTQAILRLAQIEKDPMNRVAVASAGVPNLLKGIIPNHAYAVLNASAEKQMITLANPHRSERPIDLTFDEFLQHFRRLTVANP